MADTVALWVIVYFTLYFVDRDIQDGRLIIFNK